MIAIVDFICVIVAERTWGPWGVLAGVPWSNGDAGGVGQVLHKLGPAAGGEGEGGGREKA